MAQKLATLTVRTLLTATAECGSEKMENIFCYTGEDGIDYVVYVVPSPFYKAKDDVDYCTLCVWMIPK